jgi:hypothetical protein
MSILFVDAQSRTLPRGRSTASVWLSVVLRASGPAVAATYPAPHYMAANGQMTWLADLMKQAPPLMPVIRDGRPPDVDTPVRTVGDLR